MAWPPITQLMVVTKTITAIAKAAAMVVVASYSVRQVVAKVAVEIAAVVIAAQAEVNCRNQLPSRHPIHQKIQVVVTFRVGFGVRMVLLARAETLRH